MATVENMTITVTIEQPALRLNEVAAEQITQEDIIIFGRWMKGQQGPPGPEYDDTEIRQEIAAKYTKPGTGIPATDMSEGVRTSLGKADTALQTHQDISGKQDKSSLGIDVAALGFVVKSVNDLANYYLKSDTYTKTEVRQLIGTSLGFHYEIAASTSEVTDPQSNVLYIIGPTGSGADKYEEYVYSNSTWVKIGDTSIDLSGYVTTGDLSTALSYYTTTANLSLLLDAKQNKIDSGHKLDYSLIENTPDIPENVVLYTEQTLSDEQKAQVRSNIGAGESGFSGDYNDLTNKPTLGTAAAKDVPASGNATTKQVVMGNDSRLSDSRNAADVYSWAKAATKPSYSASEVGAIPSTDKGANGGVAELDSNGKVPSSQLPSYVDDVLEYASQSAFPATGEDGKIYIAKDTNKTYRWGGSSYTEISASLALGETSSTAYAGNKGKANADAIAAIKDGSTIDSFADVEAALEANAVSGTNDGTNWTNITIGSVTKNIPSGGGGGGLSDYDFDHSDNSSVSVSTTVTFAANTRGSKMITTSGNLSVAFAVNNESDNYLWIKNSGSSEIDIAVTVSWKGTALTSTQIYKPDDGISIPAGMVCEIGIVCNNDGAFITSRSDLNIETT